MKVLYIAAAVSLLSAAVASQAFTFNTEETGTFTSNFDGTSTTVSGPFTVTASDPASNFVTDGTLIYNYLSNAAPSSGEAVSGTIDFVGPNSGDDMLFSFTGTIYGNTGAESLSGFATLTSTSGAYSIYSSGTGVISNMSIYNGANFGTTFGAFQGTLTQAVPSPIGVGILALGIAGLAIRRKIS